MKARTKAQKRRQKRGRPRLPAAERELNGGKSRRIASQQARDAENAKEARETVLQTRQRHAALLDGELITTTEAENPMRAYVLGQLHLDGVITRRQHDAGIRFAEVRARYFGMCGVPFPSARAQNMFAVHGYSGEPNQSFIEASRAASDADMKLRQLLMSMRDGRSVWSTVNSICVEDIKEARTWPAHHMGWLKRGLNALCEHYGISEDKDKQR